MHSLFGIARGSNPGSFDPKSDTLTTTLLPPPDVRMQCLMMFVCDAGEDRANVLRVGFLSRPERVGPTSRLETD